MATPGRHATVEAAGWRAGDDWKEIAAMPQAETVRGSQARTTLAVMVHGARDLRLAEIPVPAPGPGQVEIAIGAGGICGSDLHYYLEGRIGAIVVREPLVLGHEIAGTITAIGPAVEALKVGDRVAINPGLACGECRYCRAGLRLHCLDMRFYGSAMRYPHIHGGFRKVLVAEARQCVPLPADFDLTKAAFAEPLAVCLHAVERAGPLQGRNVLVTGCGPIGALTILAARHAGAARITATDVSAKALALARRIGADETIDVAAAPERLAALAANKGTFDVAFECAGAAPALRGALEATRARGIVVLVGIGGEMTLAMSIAVAKELDLRGTFRFDGEFDQAVAALVSGRIDPAPLLTDVIPIEEARRAFDLEADKARAMKVQLSFA
jgi:L-idonate 5-dehydrogenase